MAQPKCPKCGNSVFETNDIEPTKAMVIYQVINCANPQCGAIMGVLDPDADLLREMVTKIAERLQIDTRGL